MSSHCGCCFWSSNTWTYLPQVSLQAHAKILSSAAKTTLTQTFVNPSDSLLEEVSYTFPLYDGVSVVGFQCRVGSRLLHSKVKTKQQANIDYKNAVANQESAAIMDHSPSQGDVFTIRLGNVPANETITVDITFVGELKQDAETDGIRYTLPNSIAPRYGRLMPRSGGLFSPIGSTLPADAKEISITADVLMEKTSILRELQSPSHSVKVSLGRISSASTDQFEPSQASASLRLTKDNQALLERDFVLVVKADGLDNPRALLESHPTIAGQRAIMATLVPKFNLPPAKPEIIFLIDRSGSMGDKITTLKSALNVFLKSLPVGVCFNICSFGSSHSFLWPSSKIYDASSLQQASDYVARIGADMGGTEMQTAVEASVMSRLPDRDLEVLILTDGQIYNQNALFTYVREAAAANTARFFTLAIGDAASHSLIEGVARAGNGIAQAVLEYEELDRKVVRMLKGALNPHIYDYKLQVEYDTKGDHDFEVVDDVEGSVADSTTEIGDGSDAPTQQQPPNTISLFDENFTEASPGPSPPGDNDESIFPLAAPAVLQAPHKIPHLYPFIRTTVYLLLDPSASDRVPKSLSFSATSKQGPLHLSIPISDVGQGETIHQLASRKAVIELEEKHGWLEDTTDKDGNSFRQLHDDTKERVVARECQKLGIKYQVTGKHCSFVALEDNDSGDLGNEQTSSGQSKQTNTQPGASGSPKSSSQKMHISGWEPNMSTPVANPFRRYTQSMSSSFGNRPSSYACMAVSTTSDSSNMSSGGLFGVRGAGGRGGGGGSSGLRGGGRGGASRSGTSSLFGGFGSSPQSGGLFGSRAPQSPGSLFGSRAPQSSGTPQQQSPFMRRCQSSGPQGEARFMSWEPQLAHQPAETKPRSKVHELVALQSFEGNWIWNEELFSLLGHDQDHIKGKVNQVLGKGGSLQADEETVVVTLLVMGFLQHKNADSRDIWDLVYDKAQGWVQDKLKQMGTSGELIATHQTNIMALV